MAKHTKLGTIFIPRHSPAWNSSDFTDCVSKSAQVGGHSAMITPWPQNTLLSDIQTIKDACTAQGLAFHLTLDPLSTDRSAPAIPVGIGSSFTDPAVRDAFIAKVLDYASLTPTLLGLSAEINVLQPVNPNEYTALVSLLHDAYTAVKAQHPAQDVMVSVQWQKMLEWQAPDPLTIDLAGCTDVRALSVYPPVWNFLATWPTYFSTARSLLPTARLGISEMGFGSALPSSEDLQSKCLSQSVQPGMNGISPTFEFVTIPMLHDFAGYSFGLRRNDGTAKKSWTTALAMTLS